MESSKIFNIKTNKTIFAVPYGAYNQNLGVMLNRAAKLGYKQIYGQAIKQLFIPG